VSVRYAVRRDPTVSCQQQDTAVPKISGLSHRPHNVTPRLSTSHDRHWPATRFHELQTAGVMLAPV
jgi:hypothetical protein